MKPVSPERSIILKCQRDHKHLSSTNKFSPAIQQTIRYEPYSRRDSLTPESRRKVNLYSPTGMRPGVNNYIGITLQQRAAFNCLKRKESAALLP